MDDIVTMVKERNPIEDVVGESYKLPTRGRYRKAGNAKGGLVVDVHHQMYYWNANYERGDVIAWVQHEKKLDFKGAVEWLAARAGLPAPEWGRGDMAARLVTRAREDALTIAARVFAQWLWWSADAQAYAGGRGWTLEQAGTDEENNEIRAGTVERAGLGYSGEGTQIERDQMSAALAAGGVDLLSPAAVAVLGYRGNVSQWAQNHGINPAEMNEEWILNGRIPGMVGRKRLVYPHYEHGRVVYLSARAIEDKFHYNLPEILVGKRQVYFNHEYSTGESAVVVVEGQANAVSLGQWGIAAVALAGVSLDDNLVDLLRERHKTLYVALDVDTAGMLNAWKVADAFGPMARVLCARDPRVARLAVDEKMNERQREMVERANALLLGLGKVFAWPLGAEAEFKLKEGETEARQVGDINDLHQAFVENGVGEKAQAVYANALLKAAPTFAEMAAAWAGGQQGAERDAAVRQALGVIVRMGDLDRSQYRAKLAKSLSIGVRELTNMLKTYEEKEAPAADGEPVYTWGEYTHGWLLEYLYDPETEKAQLAWRDPDGVIGSGASVIIDGQKYVPEPPSEMIRNGGILFPVRLGEKKPIRELIAYIEMYLRSVYILPSESTAKLIAYYVVSTWLYDCFDAVAYLMLMGDTGSGKSELMFRVGMICYRSIAAGGASSVSSFFRMVNKYKGTVIVDEADLDKSDTTQDIIKFYNMGAMRGRPIVKMVDVVLPDGRHDYQEVAFQTFCPKMMTLKRSFQDDAVTSRSLVIRLQPRETVELVRKKISLNIDDAIREKCQAIRNLLVRYRLETWQPRIEIDQGSYDLTISARLNQIAGGLLAIASEDPEQQEAIRANLREYYRESQVTKSMTITARVIEAMWKIVKYPDLRRSTLVVEPDGRESIKIGDITRITNELIDEMNSSADDSDDEDSKKYRKGVKPHSVGRIIREDLQLQVSPRKRDGFFVYWDEARMEGVAMRYGLELDQIGPGAGESEAEKKSAESDEKIHQEPML